MIIDLLSSVITNYKMETKNENEKCEKVHFQVNIHMPMTF